MQLPEVILIMAISLDGRVIIVRREIVCISFEFFAIFIYIGATLTLIRSFQIKRKIYYHKSEAYLDVICYKEREVLPDLDKTELMHCW